MDGVIEKNKINKSRFLVSLRAKTAINHQERKPRNPVRPGQFKGRQMVVDFAGRTRPCNSLTRGVYTPRLCLYQCKVGYLKGANEWSSELLPAARNKQNVECFMTWELTFCPRTRFHLLYEDAENDLNARERKPFTYYH